MSSILFKEAIDWLEKEKELAEEKVKNLEAKIKEWYEKLMHHEGSVGQTGISTLDVGDDVQDDSDNPTTQRPPKP